MISFNQLSSRLRYSGLAAGLVGVPVLAGLFLGRTEGTWLIMVVTFLSLLFLFLAFWFCLRIWKKKKGSALSKLLRKDAASVEVSGIESLRSNFEDGVEKLRKANRNVYDLPWFLLAGQAGAGKTEALRRSHAKEDFPPGLNDMMQGVGGTLNMNWWFTNKGIILDTAGRIFEERTKPGLNNEWQEFLKMLKKARKNMPINGFILAIPADSLIRDEFNSIEEKASHIAEQITLVQNVLGVRFPVFILITKADYIPGFREFVENISEPKLQQQMLGWSNPNGLDEPFDAENVEGYLAGVITKLKKRRLTYLLDPRPTGKKRLDDLDALFSFPNQLLAALPNLKRYIEIVFSLNPWTQKPLFIRGIYFTSSLQQGEALDEAIAEVMGKNLKEMSLSPFKKEIPLFLRDVFFTKIYREQGLVTTATKVKGAMRRRSLLFLGAMLIAIAAILAASWFGSQSFNKGIGVEYDHWEYVADEYGESELKQGEVEWNRPIVYDTGVGDVFASEKDVAFEVSAETYTLPTFISRLAAFTQTELKVPAVFRPLKFFDDMLTGDSLDRDQAFRRFFEDAVTLPIIINAREKLRAATDASWDEGTATGLRTLIQLQMLLNQQERGSDYSQKFWKELNTLFRFLTEEDLGPEIQEVFADFYSETYLEKTGWPSEEFSPHYAAVDDIFDTRLAAITHGLSLWVNEIGAIRVKQESNMSDLALHLENLENIGESENQFISKAIEGQSLDHASVQELYGEYQRFTEKTRGLASQDDSFKFVTYYQQQIDAAKRSVDQQVQSLISQVEEAPDAGGELSRSVIERVDRKRQELIQSFERMVNPSLLERFENADSSYLDSDSGLELRLIFYRDLIAYRQKLSNQNLNVWTEGEKTLTGIRGLHDSLVSPVVGYVGYQQSSINKFRAIAEQDMNEAMSRISRDYCKLLQSDLEQLIGFPVFKDSKRMMSDSELAALGDNLHVITEDVLKFKEAGAGNDIQELDLLLGSLNKISNFVEVITASGALDGDVYLECPPFTKLADDLRQTIAWRARMIQVPTAGKAVRMRSETVGLGRIDLNSKSLEILFTSSVDGQPGDVGRITFRGAWAPLQLLLLSGSSVQELEKGKYAYRGRIKAAGSTQQGYSFMLNIKCPPSMPSLDTWLRSSDLKGL